MTVQEAWNRGNNLVATSIVALAGFAFFPEFFEEDEWNFKADDGLLFLLGIGAIVWYLRGKNRYTRSLVSPILLLVGFLIKLAAIFIEFSDKEDVGDDFGGMILFLLATVFVFWLYKNKPAEK